MAKKEVKRSKYSRENPPPFTAEELKQGVNNGWLKDDEENIYKFIPSQVTHNKQAEFYCEELHISVRLFRVEQRPVDPMAKWKYGNTNP